MITKSPQSGSVRPEIPLHHTVSRTAVPHHRRRVVFAAVLLSGLLLAACSSGSSAGSSAAKSPASTAAGASTAGSTATGGHTITIQNFAFHPSHLTVAPGTVVTVSNKDSVIHTVTNTAGAFNTGDIQPGQSKTFTAPNKAGTYPYICLIHQYMSGTITVS